jgi:hypothetical protein
VSQGLGGLQFMEDLSAYREGAMIFQSQAILEKFDILKELSVIHYLSPENLEIIFTNTKLAELEREEVIAFIRMRSDFKSSWIGKYI